MEVTKKPVLELVKRTPDLYKIVIPQMVEDKIRLMCKHIWTVEWSGVLFYKVSGAFDSKEDPITITCVDIFQMDEGSGTYTEFDMSADVATYMIDHPELLEEGIYQGLIHSHNNMTTFFSGTDTATLSQEGEDMAHFVSLIVNNAGTYSAAVTRRYKTVQTIKEDFTYPTWNEGEITDTKEYQVTKEVLEWYPLTVEFQREPRDYEAEMLARIAEIKAEKAKRPVYTPGSIYAGYKPATTSMYGAGKTTGGSYVPVGQYGQKDATPKKEFEPHGIDYSQREAVPTGNQAVQSDLPFDAQDENPNIPYGKVHIDEEIIKALVMQTVTGSVIIPNSTTVDIDKWAKNMTQLYSKRFFDMKEFEAFATGYIDFLVNYTDDPQHYGKLDPTEMGCLIAYEVREALLKLPKNAYLDTYIEMYDDYIL